MTVLGYIDAPLTSGFDDPTVGWAHLTVPFGASDPTITVNDTSLFPLGVQVSIVIGVRDLLTGLYSNRERAIVTVADAHTLTVISRTTNGTHVVGESLEAVVTAYDLTYHPGVMTATGDLQYLGSDGLPRRLAAGADGTFLRYGSGVPITGALLAGDIPDLSATYATPASVALQSVATLAAVAAVGYLTAVPDLSGTYVTPAALAAHAYTTLSAVAAVGYLTAVPDLSSLYVTPAALAAAGYVPTSRTVNGHALSANVTVSAADVGLGNVENTAASGVYVPLTRTINGHALSANTSITASDLSLGSVENTALSTWAGSANLTTLGTVTSGTWNSPTTITTTKSIGAVSTDGLVLQNTTAAAAGAQQWSPRLHFIAQGWKTTGTASVATDWIIENQSVQGAANPTSSLAFLSQIAGGGYTTRVGIRADGIVEVGGSGGLQIGGNSVVIQGNGNNGTTGYTKPGLVNNATAYVAWASANPWDGVDVSLYRDAAGTIAQRNGTNAQTFNLGNTYTSATAREDLSLSWQSNIAHIGATKGSVSGTARALQIDYGGTTTAAISVPVTSGLIAFGGGLKLSAAAVTGLVAGALAATTNASIVLYDSAGQAYRIPCII